MASEKCVLDLVLDYLLIYAESKLIVATLGQFYADLISHAHLNRKSLNMP